jgi:membrane protease YdiL (CAAX protease family)
MVESRPTLAERMVALAEVLVCSDYPTQFVLAGALTLSGVHMRDGTGALNIGFVAALSLADTVVLVGLIVLLLRAHGERPRDVLLGARSVGGEIALGPPLTLASLLIASTLLALLERFAPALHTVARNPLQDLLATPRETALFALVVVAAGGVREEVQRAFLLGRFERWLGGGVTGVIVVSTAFGAGHLLQGVDAALATGVLGAFWGVVYLRRRSVVAPMVSHAAFDLLQLLQFLLFGR